MIETLHNKDIFQDDLLTGEEVIWSDQPDPSVNLNRADFFLIPFTFIWAGVPFFAFFSAFLHDYSSVKILPIALMIPFLVVGLYITVGRFIFKKIIKRYTYYAVTNKRVLILTKLFGKNLKSEYINTLATINKSIRRSGIGTIIFGNNSWAKYANSGMDFFTNFNGSISPSFYDIKNANKIYKLITDLRNTQSKKH